MKHTLTLIFTCCLIFIFTIFTGCDNNSDDEEPVGNDVAQERVSDSCEGCHTNYDVLKTVYTPDPPSTGGGGCGGDAPHYEPYDRVYLSGAGYEDFKNDIHGKLGCVTCHNGVDHTADKDLAHSGDFISHPSQDAESKCGNCHPSIFNRAHNSIHAQGWGQKNMVVSRAGLDSFNQLSEMMKEGYTTNCGKCHASCGDCHINRPIAGGGGLYNGHKFNKTPDMRDHCTTCHVSRGGHAYYGIAPGTVPDIHLTGAGYTCLDCHTTNEIHGDGEEYNQRYKMPLLPKCENCHTNLADANEYHTAHLNTFNCQTCHSQDYNNCGSCHIGSTEGARIHSHQDFHIGMNPIPETKPYKYALLRQSLSAPDSWQDYGIANLENFSVAPTYKYTTPHNIQRWTTRTEVEEGKPCYDACHIIKEEDVYRNIELYLFRSDLEDWEVDADVNIVVDGHLPAAWNVQ